MTLPDRPLIVAWLLALGFGFVMVVSASVAMPRDYFSRHGIYLALALLCFLLVLAIPLRFWQRTHRLAWLAATALCALVLVPGFGQEINGARRWIDLGPFTLQPAEIAKLCMAIYLAGYLCRVDLAKNAGAALLLRPLLALAAVAGLLALQPDVGTVAVLGATACMLLFLAGARLRYFVPLALAGLGLFAALTVAAPYRLQRLASFTDPWATAFGSGYQLVQALIAFGRGELLGLGLGAGIQKLYYLPEAHNDFIFAVIAEELGLVGALALLALLAVLVHRLLRIGRDLLREGEVFGGYLCYAVGIAIGAQSLINLGVTSGLLPTKGITLPFVSYGGNSLIVCCAMIALACRARMEAGQR